MPLSTRPSIPLWRNVRVLRVVAQVLFVIVVALAGWWLFGNMARGVSRGRPLTFDFLQNAASFALAESPIPYDPDNSYAYAFLVGVLNTLRVALVGIVLASMLGLSIGIALLSSNWLLARLARAYVEVLRNTPLLIQLFVWYFAGVLKLPRVHDSIVLPGSIFLSNRGLTLPWFEPAENFGPWLQFAAGGSVTAIVVYLLLGFWPRAASMVPGRGFWAAFIALLATLGSGVLLRPFAATVPQITGFNYTGGTTLSPEYTALLFGLVVYTSAFIAEIVRAGVQSVPRGLTEASRALGLTYVQTLRLVTIPLALRVIIPPLTNQYLNLTKNSSLAVAIGYADLFYISQTILNQSGQTVQVIVMIMGAYLAMSLVIALVMNRVNARFKLIER